MTLVDVDGTADPRQLSLSARHEVVLEDGRRVPLSEARGWDRAPGELVAGEFDDAGLSHRGQTDMSAGLAVEAVREVLRVVVGPDKSPAGRACGDIEADREADLRRILEQHGAVLDSDDLRRLPHGVVLSERLLTLIGRDVVGHNAQRSRSRTQKMPVRRTHQGNREV